MFRNIFRQKVTQEQIIELVRQRLQIKEVEYKLCDKIDRLIVRYMKQEKKLVEDNGDLIVFHGAVSGYVKGECKNPFERLAKVDSLREALYGRKTREK